MATKYMPTYTRNMVSDRPRAPQGREYRQGDHICLLYDSPAEQLAVAVDYIADGLARNERCLYSVTTQAGLDEFSRALTAAGIDAPAAVRERRLLLLTKDAAHLRPGYFDAEAMLHQLSALVEDALNDGYAGLRTCGDMSWLLDEAPGSEQIIDYEGLLNAFFRSVRATGMCQYDATRIPEGLLHHALATHPSCVADNRHRANPFFIESADASRPGAATIRAKMATLSSETL